MVLSRPPPSVSWGMLASRPAAPRRAGEEEVACAQARCVGRALGPLAASAAEGAVGILSGPELRAGRSQGPAGCSEGRAGRDSLGSGGGFFPRPLLPDGLGGVGMGSSRRSAGLRRPE